MSGIARQDNTEILEWVLRTLRELQLVDAESEVDETTGLLGRGIGLDSVEVLRLVAAIENGYGLTLEDDELTADGFRSVGAVVAFVRHKLDRLTRLDGAEDAADDPAT